MSKSKEDPSTEQHHEDTWSFRGYQLRSVEFVNALSHFYRGELGRSNVWRTRLDNTTNWSVITTAAVLTFAFGAVEHSHVVILISMFLISLFLVIESRRYRYYELWTLRVRLMETEFFSTMLQPPFTPHHEWASRLVDSLLSPEFPISFWEALGRRLRRNYIWLFLVLGLAWTIKLALFPAPALSLGDLMDHAEVGFLPGRAVVAVTAMFYMLIFVVAFFTAGLRTAPGEVLSHREALGISGEIWQSLARAATEIPFVNRKELLAIIITEQPQAVGDQLLSVFKRGVTSLQGKGMYSGQDRSVLFCAVTPSETRRLKLAVYSADEKAFVVVNPTEEVLGGAFGDLRPNWWRWKKKESGRE